MNQYEIDHNNYIRKYAPECTVLLKSNGVFPINPSSDDKEGKWDRKIVAGKLINEKIALYGNGVRGTIKGGTGSGEVNSREYVTVEQAFEEAEFEIMTKAWLDAYDEIYKASRKQFVKDMKAKARKHHTLAVMESMGAVMPEPEYDIPLRDTSLLGDTIPLAIYVLARISGEGSDRAPVSGDILLTPSEIRDILWLQKHAERFLLVLNVGGVVDLAPVQAVDNILLLSQLGAMTGSVLVDLVLGKSYPSGKLATTWARCEDYCDIGEFGDRDDTRYKEGIYVGYRYFDTARKVPLYPFGYGLSYTSFQVQIQEVELNGNQVAMQVATKNIGNYIGKEVIQCYVSVPSGKLDQPYQMLATFGKTKELRPNEEECLTLQFRMTDLASYDEKCSSYILEAGDYILRVGTSSRDTEEVAVISIEEEVIVKKVHACCDAPDFKDYAPQKADNYNCEYNSNCSSDYNSECILHEGLEEYQDNSESQKPIKVLKCDAQSFVTESVSYDVEINDADIPQLIDELSLEELCYMNVGGFNPKAGFMSVIGDASSTVAGAAGETTTLLQNKGIPTMVMSDGPAGLRLSKQYTRDDKGVHSMGMTFPDTITEFLPGPIRIMMSRKKKPKKNQAVYEQYATAIPIGTAIAQSFNEEFAKQCGDIIGDEMERFGVHLWLAPAMNIHRSIRCGRNFEYYSEDPVVSGRFAAALTLGVQAHSGCGVTIKHFAANNQETNRYNNNSIVSERSLREIYLRGYEICVRLAKPVAVMTSYNLLNGEHTSESRRLIEDVLRHEFGFDGIVMTDWIVNGGTMNKKSIHPAPSVWKVASASGDLFMPGGKREYKQLLKAVRQGKISEHQLKQNASRVYVLAKKLN